MSDSQEPRSPFEELIPEAEEGGNVSPFGAALDEGAAAPSSLQDDLDKAKDQLLRALAETENVRRRAIKERDDAGKYAVSNFARDLLDFADNFHRAMDAVPADLRADDRVAGVMTGLEAMEQQMMRVFEKHGIKKVMPADEMFDPHFHEVMFEAPGTGKPGGTIIQVIEPGFTIAGRLLRPARVGVAKAEGGARVDTSA